MRRSLRRRAALASTAVLGGAAPARAHAIGNVLGALVLAPFILLALGVAVVLFLWGLDAGWRHVETWCYRRDDPPPKGSRLGEALLVGLIGLFHGPGPTVRGVLAAAFLAAVLLIVTTWRWWSYRTRPTADPAASDDTSEGHAP